MSDKRPPPSREHFESFVSRILAVPKEAVDRLAAERREKRTPKAETPQEGERVDGNP